MGFLLGLLEKALKIPLVQGPVLFYKGLKKLGLYSWIIFFVFVVPGIIGSYSFFLSRGLEWYFAAPAAFGVEIGGVLFNVIHGFQQIPGAGPWAVIVIVAGMMSSLTNFIWTAYIWYKLNKVVEGQNLSILYIVLIGGVMLFLFVAITLFVDQYVLSEEVQRLSGMTYVLSSPREALAPMLDVLQGWSSTPNPENATTLLNSTNPNSSVGG